jgi:hypothetical protein
MKAYTITVKSKYRILSKTKKQVGKSKIALDRHYQALPSGKRVSKFGKVYYEHRKNRTDSNRNKRL